MAQLLHPKDQLPSLRDFSGPTHRRRTLKTLLPETFFSIVMPGFDRHPGQGLG